MRSPSGRMGVISCRDDQLKREWRPNGKIIRNHPLGFPLALNHRKRVSEKESPDNGAPRCGVARRRKPQRCGPAESLNVAASPTDPYLARLSSNCQKIRCRGILQSNPGRRSTKMAVTLKWRVILRSAAYVILPFASWIILLAPVVWGPCACASDIV